MAASASGSRRILATPSPFARQHCNYVQEAGVLAGFRPGGNRGSDLNSYLFFLVTGGRGAFHYEGSAYPLRQGDCVWADCRRPYRQESSPQSPLELKWVHFYGHDVACFYEAFLERTGSVVFTPPSPGALNEILSAVLTLYEQDAAEKELLSHRYLTDLMTECLTQRGYPPAPADATRQKLEAVRTYLKEHYQEAITLDRLASLCYLSKYHLARSYRQAFGVTPGNDLTGIRLSRAKSLLRFTAEPVSGIAGLCGYPDANYFAKVFKKWEGMTPLEYRRRW